jgi:hypothetical protein
MCISSYPRNINRDLNETFTRLYFKSLIPHSPPQADPPKAEIPSEGLDSLDSLVMPTADSPVENRSAEEGTDYHAMPHGVGL